MNKGILLLALLVTFNGLSQNIEIIQLDKGFKEIDLTKPVTPANPAPVPDQNGSYRFTHQLGVYCEDDASGQKVELIQYLNLSNGLVGMFGEDIARSMPETADQSEGKMDFWAFLPNKTQRMYVQSAEHGKLVMQQSASDPHTGATYTTTMARFDAFTNGQLFWRNAKKTKTITVPAHLLKGSQAPMALDVYTFQSEDGPVQITLNDLGLASGSWKMLDKIHAATVMGGLGYVHNLLNKHVYLVFSVTNATAGCRLTSLQAKSKTFSGAGYKPAGDLILDKLADNQEKIQQEAAERQVEINEEEDAVLRQLYQQQAKLQASIQKEVTDAVTNAGMFNDMADVATAGVNANHIVALSELELQIKERKLQIELERLRKNEASAEEILVVQRKLNCIPVQRQLLIKYRNDLTALRKRYQNPDKSSEYLEKSSRLLLQFNEQMLRSCPEK